ncbi:MAG: L-seryl-tRNA(Sec) selenium transferase [Pirellulaceae bacterium]|nr:L-seryl-tRNA(Sec) selenium transferase [Pirellulaceae bacterium]
MPNVSNPFRGLPSVNQLLESPQLKTLVDSANHNVVVGGVRTFLDHLREQISAATEEVQIPTPQELAEKIASWISGEEKPHLRSVINATGVILHTGLGRAPLADEAINEITAMAQGYASVEIDLTTGKRSQRDLAVKKLLCQLTGAPSATVVNNNAAATMLALSAMATGKEVIVSRGQLVEIGGSYRLPDVMECSRAKLKEVGTTNKTRLSDYESAINENTGAILRVHPSNYRVVGFTESVPLEDLVKLARKHNIPVIDDVGSGALVDFAAYGLDDEPLVCESVQQGADVVLFSGDKLVGGPQCGIVVGQDHWIQKIKKHPMTRAMRVDKMTLAALAATLRMYRDPDSANRKIPLLAMLSTSEANLKLRAARLAEQIASAQTVESATPVAGSSTLGGGTLPEQYLATWCVGIKPAGLSVDEFSQKLRVGTPSIFGRINQDQLLLDLRTVLPKYDVALVDAITGLENSDEPSQDTAQDAG